MWFGIKFCHSCHCAKILVQWTRQDVGRNQGIFSSWAFGQWVYIPTGLQCRQSINQTQCIDLHGWTFPHLPCPTAIHNPVPMWMWLAGHQLPIPFSPHRLKSVLKCPINITQPIIWIFNSSGCFEYQPRSEFRGHLWHIEQYTSPWTNSVLWAREQTRTFMSQLADHVNKQMLGINLDKNSNKHENQSKLKQCAWIS